MGRPGLCGQLRKVVSALVWDGREPGCMNLWELVFTSQEPAVVYLHKLFIILLSLNTVSHRLGHDAKPQGAVRVKRKAREH